MLKATLLSLTLMAAPALALCDHGDQLVARYRLEPSAQPAQDLTLVRQGNRVALHWPARGFTERWTRLSNGQMQLERLFEQYHRGIEYQHKEIVANSGSRLWQRKHQLIPQAAVEALPLVEVTGGGCDAHQRRSDGTTELLWLAQLNLVERLTTPHQQLTLVGLERGAQAVSPWMARWDSYQLTDYADIGDNEQDPLLSRMINQGFRPAPAREAAHHHHH